jgi:hypothetical protein
VVVHHEGERRRQRGEIDGGLRIHLAPNRPRSISRAALGMACWLASSHFKLGRLRCRRGRMRS